MQKEILRIIDANFNRSREGLRVCEDIARFILNSPSLFEDLKLVRHGISGILKRALKSKALFDARNTTNDIGRSSRFKSEMSRIDAADIFYANIERVKESVRVLEEFFKLIDRQSSSKLTVLRYRIYDIEKRFIKKIPALRNIR